MGSSLGRPCSSCWRRYKAELGEVQTRHEMMMRNLSGADKADLKGLYEKVLAALLEKAKPTAGFNA